MEPTTSPQPSTPDQSPTPPPSTPSQQISPSPQPAKKRKGIIIGIIVGTFLIIAVAASVVAYSMYQTPQKVVTDAIMSLATAESLTHKGTFNLSSNGGNQPIDIELTYDGSISKDGIVTNGTIKMTRSGKTASVKVDTVIASDQSMYVKINDPKSFVSGYVELMGSDISGDSIALFYSNTISTIENKWIKIDLKEAEGFNEAADTQKCFQDALAKIKNDKAIAGEIKDAYTKNQFISIKKELGMKDISGVNSIGYEIGTDEAKTKAFFDQIKNSKLAEELKKCDSDIDLTYDGAKKSDDNASATLEVWAAQFGHKLTRIEIRRKSADNDTTGKFVFEPKINVPVTVTAPTNTISTDTVIEAFKKDAEINIDELR